LTTKKSAKSAAHKIAAPKVTPAVTTPAQKITSTKATKTKAKSSGLPAIPTAKSNTTAKVTNLKQAATKAPANVAAPKIAAPRLTTPKATKTAAIAAKTIQPKYNAVAYVTSNVEVAQSQSLVSIAAVAEPAALVPAHPALLPATKPAVSPKVHKPAAATPVSTPISAFSAGGSAAFAETAPRTVLFQPEVVDAAVTDLLLTLIDLEPDSVADGPDAEFSPYNDAQAATGEDLALMLAWDSRDLGF
jgi:hypothetical protein